MEGKDSLGFNRTESLGKVKKPKKLSIKKTINILKISFFKLLLSIYIYN